MVSPSRYPLYPSERDRMVKQFLDQYDYMYWILKLETYHQIIENIEEFSEAYGTDWMDEAGIEKYRYSLESELVYMFYHTSEALFSLIMSFKNSDVPPLEMKRIGFGHICQFVRNTLNENDFGVEEVRDLFYFEEQEEEPDRIEESIGFVNTYLNRI